MRAVNEPIENGVGDRGIADQFMPAVRRELTGDQGGRHALPVVQDLQEVAVLDGGCLFHPPVVDDQQVRLGELLEQRGQRTGGLTGEEFPKQFWRVE